MRGHSSLRREPAVLLMYRGVEGYKVAEIALGSLHTQLCYAKRDGSGQRMLRTGSSKLEAACGSHPESQRSMISMPVPVIASYFMSDIEMNLSMRLTPSHSSGSGISSWKRMSCTPAIISVRLK